jgi:hypothetical protein
MKKVLLIILIFFSICTRGQIYERKIPYDYSKINSWTILSRKHGDTISLADFYVAHRDGTLIGLQMAKLRVCCHLKKESHIIHGTILIPVGN